MTPLRDRVLELLAQRRRALAYEIAHALGVETEDVYEVLVSLEASREARVVPGACACPAFWELGCSARGHAPATRESRPVIDFLDAARAAIGQTQGCALPLAGPSITRHRCRG